jgi:hypothetical protein
MSDTAQVGGPAPIPKVAKLSVPVPWDRAESFQGFLKGRGIGSTLHLDPDSREARLEPWDVLSADQLEKLLAEWRGPGPEVTAAAAVEPKA